MILFDLTGLRLNPSFHDSTRTRLVLTRLITIHCTVLRVLVECIIHSFFWCHRYFYYFLRYHVRTCTSVSLYMIYFYFCLLLHRMNGFSYPEWWGVFGVLSGERSCHLWRDVFVLVTLLAVVAGDSGNGFKNAAIPLPWRGKQPDKDLNH